MAEDIIIVSLTHREIDALVAIVSDWLRDPHSAQTPRTARVARTALEKLDHAA